MSTCPAGKLGDVDLRDPVCLLVWHWRNAIKMFLYFGDVIRNSRWMGAILIFTPDCGYVYLSVLWTVCEVKIRKFKGLGSCPCYFSIIEEQVSLWHMLVEQFTRAQALDRFWQLISHALWKLYGVRCRGLFVWLTPIVRNPLFREPIVWLCFGRYRSESRNSIR